MRVLPLAAAVAALLAPAAPAQAGDPIMPLWQVSAGMQCTGYSVIQGMAISSFNVRVLYVAAGEATSGGGRILFEVSGPAVDATGIGPGFSGSPIHCPDEGGHQRVIGAIAESINEYGGKVALATPIEAIIGTPVDVPGRPSAAAPTPTPTIAPGAGASRAAGRSPAAQRAAFERKRPSARMRAAMASAKPLAAPLTVSGVTGPVAKSLAAASAKAGRPVLAALPGPPARSRRRRCGRAPRSRPVTRMATSAPARSGRSPTWTATACGSSGTRSSRGRRAPLLQDEASGSSTTRN